MWHSGDADAQQKRGRQSHVFVFMYCNSFLIADDYQETVSTSVAAGAVCVASPDPGMEVQHSTALQITDAAGWQWAK
jgi:hypothetical protein